MLTTLAGHHAAVVPAAADADRAAGRRRGVRLHRGAPGRRPRRLEPAHRDPGRRRGRAGRRAWRSARTSPTCCGPTSPSPTPTPTATANAATAARPAPSKYYAEIDQAILRGHRQAPQPDRRADRRLQLPVLLPLLGLPGPDLALRQPAGAVRQARRRHRGLVRRSRPPSSSSRALDDAAVAGADGVPDAPRRRSGPPTRCGWPRTSTPTSPTCGATPSNWTPRCSPDRSSPSRTSARSCWPSASPDRDRRTGRGGPVNI